jgi:hypothetical protein
MSRSRAEERTAAALERLASVVERQERESSAAAIEERLGRGKQPRKLRLTDYIKAVPGMAERFREVPSSAVESNNDTEALVNCPCGAHPVVTEELIQCPDCERFYTYDGRVWVAYGDMEPPERPTPASS